MFPHVEIKKLKNSSSDHVPVVASFVTNKKIPIHNSAITKRSQKLFTKERWNESLASRNWNEIYNCENIDDMVEIFTANVTEVMDEITPIKTFKIKSHHKFGLSEVAKEIMRQRDKCREGLKNASPSEKQ